MILIDTRTDARKEKIDTDQAWNILSQAGTVHIGKGKKTLVYSPCDENKEEILKAAMGRTGNLRAPSIKKKDAVFIGFNDSIYNTL